MKTRGEFTSLGTRSIAGKRMKVAEHKLQPYFRIGTTNIPATSLAHAIEKFVAYLEKNAADQSRVAHL